MRLNRLMPTRHSSATSSHTALTKLPRCFTLCQVAGQGFSTRAASPHLGPHSILLQDQQGVNGQPLTPYTTGWANHLGT